MINTLIKLSENDKRILIALLIIVLLIVIIVGYITKLVRYIMRKQGRMVDNMMVDIVKANLVTTPKEFKKVAREKNFRQFYFEALPPMGALIILSLVVLLYQLFMEKTNLNYIIEYISKLSFELSFPTTYFFGINIISDWPTIVKGPEFFFNFDSIIAYLVLLVGIYFIIHFSICVQALIAREWRLRHAATTVFQKDLDTLSKPSTKENLEQ